MKPKLYLLNGPLGAGKTTLLRHLITQPRFKDARIIENEFASTSVDTAQLHDHIEEVRTIAGVCICCSTGNELADTLNDLSDSPAPVIIEATGVANSLIILEKLLVSDTLHHYDLASALFVLDAAAFDDTTIPAYKDELLAADHVFLTKTDLVDESQVMHLLDSLKHAGITTVVTVLEGVVDATIITETSAMIAHFATVDSTFTAHDITMNHTVVSMKDMAIDPEYLTAQWPALATKYALKRMKGDFRDAHGTVYHVEATPAQCRVTKANQRDELLLVCIGERALEITLATVEEVFAGELA